MANLIIKPTSGGSLILQDEGGTAANTIDASGNTQLAGTLGVTGATTLSGTTNNLGTSTAGTLSSGVIFPAGHIIQTVFAPTIVANTTGHTSEAVAASVTNQITITSGNGVLIYVQAQAYMDRSSNDMGYVATIRETALVGGTLLAEAYNRDSVTSGNWWESFTLMAYDASPADTTPDYCLCLARTSSGANNVKLESTSATDLKFFLIEIKQ